MTDDVLQTVVIRWKKMCDDMKQEKRQAIGSWQLPRRVELAVDRWMFRFSSYMFSDENETVNLIVGRALSTLFVCAGCL